MTCHPIDASLFKNWSNLTNDYFVQAIIEAKNKQLDLRDIYAWFLANFAHFRHCNLTWKVNINNKMTLKSEKPITMHSLIH